MQLIDNSQHISWMRQALLLADRAEAQGEVPVGALVVLDKQIIGVGWNQSISRHDPSAHAEIIALRAAALHLRNYRLTGCSLYVTIEPCTMCAGAIIHARIKELIFGAAEPKAGAIISNDNLLDKTHFNTRIQYQANILGQQCASKISNFFQQRRRLKK